MFAYFNKSKNELNFVKSNEKGVAACDNGTVYIKTNNVLCMSFEQLEEEKTIPSGNYLIHVNYKLYNNDICFLDTFASIDEVMQNPYTIDLQINGESVNSAMLVDTVNPVIEYSTTIAKSITEETTMTVSSNYTNLDVISIQIILEEVMGEIKSLD